MRPLSLAIKKNVKITEGHYILEVDSSEIARTARPGQFVQILMHGMDNPLLPRPFSFLDIERSTLKILYQVVGQGTKILSEKKRGDEISLLGPLGNGFTYNKKPKQKQNMILVGGGVGIPPLFHLAKTVAKNKNIKTKYTVQVFLGGRNKKLLHYRNEFSKLGCKPRSPK